MRRHLWWLPLWALLVCPQDAQARQDPIGPFVIDVRGLMAGLPVAEGWTLSDVPAGTEVPSRGFGAEVGVHVFVGRLGAARLGLGGSLGLARGTTTAATVDAAEVVTRLTTAAPQVSLNFGQRLGWSYLSAGYGGVRVNSEVSPAVAAANVLAPGWSGAVNIGGGARWFLSEHVGVGFDARWHRVSGREASTGIPAAARTTLFHLAVGLSLQ